MKTKTNWVGSLLNDARKIFGAAGMVAAGLLFFSETTVWSGCADDPTFLPEGGGANSTVRAVAIDSTGGVLLGGDFYGMFGNTSPLCFGRVLADGTWQGYVDVGLNAAV